MACFHSFSLQAFDLLELRPGAEASLRTRQQTTVLGWNRAWSDTTVGATAIRLSTFRPFNGSSCTARLPTTEPTEASWACRRGAAPVT